MDKLSTGKMADKMNVLSCFVLKISVLRNISYLRLNQFNFVYRVFPKAY